MKRSPLKRGTSQLKRTPIKRSRKPIAPMSEKQRNEREELRMARESVLERADGWCEARFSVRCTRRATQVHHIQLRSCGGTHDPTNLLAICEECHTGSEGIHMFPADAEAAGWIRPSPPVYPPRTVG